MGRAFAFAQVSASPVRKFKNFASGLETGYVSALRLLP